MNEMKVPYNVSGEHSLEVTRSNFMNEDNTSSGKDNDLEFEDKYSREEPKTNICA
jgi:hypothetical protein